MTAPLRLDTPLPASTFRVHECFAREALSEVGETRLRLLSERVDIAAGDLLGKPVTLTIALRDNASRRLSGYVTRFVQGGFEGRHCVYEMTLKPWPWLLTRTADCRIFQDMTVPDIVAAVFQDHPVARFELKLMRPYRTWTYCVQYRETDFNFVARLLEQEGIYWYVEHDERGHKLVLCDAATAHDAAPGCESLPFYGGADQAPPQLEHISQWTSEQSMQPGKVVLTDYDFERPSAALQTEQSRARGYDLSDGEIFDFPGGYTQASDGSQYAEDRLDEWHSAFNVLSASTNAQGVSTGRLLAMSRHPRDDQNAQYLVTSTTLTLRQAANESGTGHTDLRCDFRAIPATQQFRPSRRTPKPLVAGPQTASVTGPAGEEIHTDAYGRVKVQFHWDRRGRRDERSSCWIRVSQPWAGKGWGGVSIPRIGQEVIVDFIEGDPDQPLITGRVYNAEQMPPYGLPDGAMVSGIKSKTHKGTGYNELSMDDTAGQEKMTLHAQYDMSTTVLHDQTNTINNNRSTTVTVDDTLTVNANRTMSVVGKLAETVSAGHELTVTGGATHTVNDGYTQTITGATSRTMNGDLTHTVNGKQENTVNGHFVETVTAGEEKTVQSGKRLTVTGGYTQNITGALDVQTTGAVTQGATATLSLHANGAGTYTSATSLTLGVGGSTIVIDAGSVTISAGGSVIKVDASGVSVNGTEISLNC